MQELKIEHFGISVTDIKESTNWYQDVFGFEEVKEFEKPDLQIKGAVMKRGDLSLEILQPYAVKKCPSEDGPLVTRLQRIGANHLTCTDEGLKPEAFIRAIYSMAGIQYGTLLPVP
ncbi:MAG: VOC family protein [Proteobacteria bacterium]|nr:VOC family protein [Pseudomonadota bacterium]